MDQEQPQTLLEDLLTNGYHLPGFFGRSIMKHNFHRSYPKKHDDVSFFLIGYTFQTVSINFKMPFANHMGFAGGRLERKAAVIRAYMMDYENWVVDYESIVVNPHLETISTSELEEQTKDQAKMLALRFQRPVLLDSPKRGFKPYELFVYESSEDGKLDITTLSPTLSRVNDLLNGDSLFF